MMITPSSLEALSEDELKKRAPAVFTNVHKMSQIYSQINTIDVVRALEEADYFPVDAKQHKPRCRDPLFVNHIVIMRHMDHIGRSAKELSEVPQILITNSHNGRTKLRFRAGIYRFVCANGLVIGSDLMKFAIRHAGDSIKEALSFAEMMTGALPMLTFTIQRLQGINLSVIQCANFARDAAKLRFGESASSYDPNDLLTMRRVSDAGFDLWHVFNRVQENCIVGGIEGVSENGRSLKSKPINGIERGLTFNQDLWNLANEYAEAA
jgi:hypothetical protein